MDGRSGAGKTSLAAALSSRLRAQVVSLEDLYRGWDGLEHGIDLLVSAVLEPLAAGRAAHVPRYDWVGQAVGRADGDRGPADSDRRGGRERGAARGLFESVFVWLEVPAPDAEEAALTDGATFTPCWDQSAAQERRARPRAHSGPRQHHHQITRRSA